MKKTIRKIGGKSIDERREEINNRQELGHWEMDTVVGKICSKRNIETKKILQDI